ALELDEPEGPEEDDEDASPYATADQDLPRCRKCHKEMPVGAVMCTSCGFNQKKKRKATRTYQEIHKTWDTDMTVGQRLMWIGYFNAIHWTLAVVSAAVDIGAMPFFVTWPLLMANLIFVVGTYDRVELERDRRGRVRVTTRWRFCFIP